jgi:hypothetical protein
MVRSSKLSLPWFGGSWIRNHPGADQSAYITEQDSPRASHCQELAKLTIPGLLEALVGLIRSIPALSQKEIVFNEAKVYSDAVYLH